MPTEPYDLMNPNEASSDWENENSTVDQELQQRAETLKIVTYVGSSISIIGVLLTIVFYIGYKKFHIKRPHIIVVNLCVCLLIYYLVFIISNGQRQDGYILYGHITNPGVCLFGAIVSHFAVLSSWMWLTVYWFMVLIMYQRPMGGHVSHFFIKAGCPAYGIPLAISAICGIVANTNGDISLSNEHGGKSDEGYYGSQCFVNNQYLYLGLVLPLGLLLLPICGIAFLVLRGMCSDGDRSKTSTSYRNVKSHYIRLSITTLLFAIVITSSLFVPNLKSDMSTSYASIMLFSVVSSLLGLALMILFCINQSEIRRHWLSVMRGEQPTMRHHSMSGKQFETSMSTARKSSTLMGNHPSVYIENFNEERKSSTYRIVAKEDTDMSTLGLIQIPGTPSPNRLNEVNGENGKGRHSSPKHSRDEESEPLTPKENDEFSELKEKSDNNTWKSRKKTKATRSTSTPPVSPREKKTKRQQSFDQMQETSSSKSPSSTHPHEKKKAEKIEFRFKNGRKIYPQKYDHL